MGQIPNEGARFAFSDDNRTIGGCCQRETCSSAQIKHASRLGPTEWILAVHRGALANDDGAIGRGGICGAERIAEVGWKKSQSDHPRRLCPAERFAPRA